MSENNSNETLGFDRAFKDEDKAPKIEIFIDGEPVEIADDSSFFLFILKADQECDCGQERCPGSRSFRAHKRGDVFGSEYVALHSLIDVMRKTERPIMEVEPVGVREIIMAKMASDAMRMMRDGMPGVPMVSVASLDDLPEALKEAMMGMSGGVDDVEA